MMKIPKYQLQKVYEDGSREEPAVYELHELPGLGGCRMGRRGFLFTSAIGAGLLASLAGCAPQVITNGATKQASNSGQADLEPLTFPSQASPLRSTSSVKAHKGGINSLEFSPDGKLLASMASEDNTIKLWAIPGAKLLHTITEDQSPCDLVFSPDGKILYSCTVDGVLASRSAPFKGKKSMLDRDAGNSFVAISPDGKMLAMLSGWGGLQLRQLPGGTMIREIETKYFTLAFTPDSAMLAGCGSSSPRVALHAVPSGKVVREWGVSADGIAISPDGALLAARQKYALLVWDIASGKQHSALAISKRSYSGTVAFSPNGDWLATIADNGYPVMGVMLLPKPFNKSGPLLMGHNDSVSKLAFSSDGRFLAAGMSNGGIFIWEMPHEQSDAKLHAVLLDPTAMDSKVSIRQAATAEKKCLYRPMRRAASGGRCLHLQLRFGQACRPLSFSKSGAGRNVLFLRLDLHLRADQVTEKSPTRKMGKGRREWEKTADTTISDPTGA